MWLRMLKLQSLTFHLPRAALQSPHFQRFSPSSTVFHPWSRYAEMFWQARNSGQVHGTVLPRSLAQSLESMHLIYLIMLPNIIHIMCIYNIMEGYMNLLHMCFYYLVALCMPIAKHPFGFFGKTLGPLCQILRTHQSDCASQTQKT